MGKTESTAAAADPLDDLCNLGITLERLGMLVEIIEDECHHLASGYSGGDEVAAFARKATHAGEKGILLIGVTKNELASAVASLRAAEEAFYEPKLLNTIRSAR